MGNGYLDFTVSRRRLKSYFLLLRSENEGMQKGNSTILYPEKRRAQALLEQMQEQRGDG